MRSKEQEDSYNPEVDEEEEDELDTDTLEEDGESEGKKSGHSSLLTERYALVVDEDPQRRNLTVEIVQSILPNAEIDNAATPEEAEGLMEENDYDTYVVNFLMPGYSSSNFVKAVCNHPKRPLLVGFSADKMSDAWDPKKGVKIKPLSRIFEMETVYGNGDPEADKAVDSE